MNKPAAISENSQIPLRVVGWAAVVCIPIIVALVATSIKADEALAEAREARTYNESIDHRLSLIEGRLGIKDDK